MSGFPAGCYLLPQFVNAEVTKPLGAILRVVAVPGLELLEEANHADLPQFF